MMVFKKVETCSEQ